MPAAPSSSAAGRRAVSASRHSFVSLRSQLDIKRVLRDGRRSRSPHMTVVCIPGPSDTPRVAVIAGKKVGKAVERNRAKRRMRAAAEAAQLSAGTDYVLIANRSTVDAPFQSLVGAIER